MLHSDNGVVRHGGRVRESERERFDGPVERAPDVDDAHATLTERGGFVGQVQADARKGRGEGLVDVHARHGGAVGGGGGAADGVVENMHAVGAEDGGEQERLDFGVVSFGDGGVGGEVGLLGRAKAGDELEGVGVEPELGFVAAGVSDGHSVLGVGEVALGKAGGGGFDVVERGGVVGRWGEEFQGGGYGTAGDGIVLLGGGGDSTRHGCHSGELTFLYVLPRLFIYLSNHQETKRTTSPPFYTPIPLTHQSYR